MCELNVSQLLYRSCVKARETKSSQRKRAMLCVTFCGKNLSTTLLGLLYNSEVRVRESLAIANGRVQFVSNVNRK